MTGFLSGLRVLDLTDERGLLAGHMLAKLGADVVQVEGQVEGRAGSPARRQPPFDPAFDPVSDPGAAGQNSCFWSAFAAGKRSLLLDPDAAAGRATLRQLLARADILLESADPAQRQRWQLSPAQTRAVNPHLIHVSITAFGLDGPKAHWAATDLTVWAAGGALLPSCDSDGTPLRMSVPQSFLNAAADAAGGALMALAARHRSGLGQHVDIAAQQSASICTLAVSLAAAVGHPDFSIPGAAPRPRPGQKPELDLSGSGARTRRSKWQVKDGLVEMHLGIGPAGGGFANNLFSWLHAAGACPDDIAAWDWKTLPQRILDGEIGEADLERARTCVAQFLAGFTKQELQQQAIDRRLLCAPIATTTDLLASPQLASRNFFIELVEASGARRTLPGPFCAGVPAAFAALTPAPAPGQHSQQVLAQWLAPAPVGTATGVEAAGIEAAKVGSTGSERAGVEIAEQATTTRDAAPAAPLAGLRVLDLAWVVAGPLIGRSLADFGADVIRVESSRRIETARMMGPFPGGKPDPQQSALFENCNAGKRGLTLNLASAEGRQIIRELVAQWADVVIEAFSPGQMQSWGLGYADLRQLKPGLIMLSTSLMGQTGPWHQFAGYGNVGAAVSGFQAIVGWPGRLPTGPFGPYTDFVGPRFGLVALLAALEERRRSGSGCWLDVAQAEAGVQFLAPQIAHAAATGTAQQAQGNRDPLLAPHGVFECEPVGDNRSWIAIAVRDDDEWQRLAALICADAGSDPRWLTLAGRKTHEDALEALLQDWTRHFSAAALEARLQAAAIAAHRVAAPDDMLADPQLQHRHHYQSLPHALMGTTTVEHSRLYLSATPAQIARPAPHFGRDNTEVLTTLLGYTPEHIAALAAAGVLS